MVDIIEFRPKERRSHERPERREATIIPLGKKTHGDPKPVAELTLDGLADLPPPGLTNTD